MLGHVEVDRAGDLAAEPMLGHGGIGGDAGTPRLQRCADLISIVSDTGNNTQTRDDNSSHKG
jgi:hypothetical protein